MASKDFVRWSADPQEDSFPTRRAFWQDKKLNPNAKALMGYLLSLPPDHPISISSIQAEFRGTPAYMGKHFLQVAIKNLIEHGYMWRRQVPDERQGVPRWEYLYSDTPFDPGWGWHSEQWGPPGYVYYARLDNGLVKIGRSTDPVRRLKAMMQSASYAQGQKLVDAFCYHADDAAKAENQAHHLHAKDRINAQLDLFLLSPEAYAQRCAEMGGTRIEIIDGTAVAA